MDTIEQLIGGISNSETVYFQLYDKLGKPMTGGQQESRRRFPKRMKEKSWRE
ncbi:hypothetical protein [Paenibacillus piri]|uniref:hypothetical protein n=1 Tax=Paenibacillus piri TaxID=2547395 RepID=UPI00140433FC|nr:hypothetical protein [Paenibacillus piri]